MSKNAHLIKRKYPFLENFPFKEFTLESGEAHRIVADEDGGVAIEDIEPTLMKFVYEKDNSSMTVFIFDRELRWMNEISERVQDLNSAVKAIDRAIDSPDLLAKRNGANYAEAWCSQLQDNRSKLSYSTSGDILTSLVDGPDQLVTVINKIIKLNSGIGMVGLSTKEYQIILTYYQFQLIYAKLLLGIIIASKISL